MRNTQKCDAISTIESHSIICRYVCWAARHEWKCTSPFGYVIQRELHVKDGFKDDGKDVGVALCWAHELVIIPDDNCVRVRVLSFSTARSTQLNPHVYGTCKLVAGTPASTRKTRAKSHSTVAISPPSQRHFLLSRALFSIDVAGMRRWQWQNRLLCDRMIVSFLSRALCARALC